MVRPADAGVAVAPLVGFFLRERDHVLDGAKRRRRMDDEQAAAAAHMAELGERLEDVVADLREVRRDGERAAVEVVERVAVGGGPRAGAPPPPPPRAPGG